MNRVEQDSDFLVPLANLFSSSAGRLATLNPLEFAGLKVVTPILEFAQNPLPGQPVLELPDGLLYPVILHLDFQPKLDTSDALAAAVCHLNWTRYEPRGRALP